MNLIGRKEEKIILKDMFDSLKAEFLAIYGRRRIGKTYLVKQFFGDKDCVFFSVTGIQGGLLTLQLGSFAKELGRAFFNSTEIKEPKNWFKAFEVLTDVINKLLPPQKKIVLFFDEFPWMVTHKSNLLSALDHFWNQNWSNDSRIKLIICGSSASWIINKIINNKGGLHNRITRRIQLMPFNLEETKSLLEMQGLNLNHRQITQLYMSTGGIPYYLQSVRKGFSATQLVEQLAFQKNSILFKEFDNLFSSLFADAGTYIKLLKIIAKNRYGLGQEEIVKQSGDFSRGGRLIKKLTDLEEAGFIISFTPHFHKKKGVYYRLIDEYTLFYLYWIEPVRNTLQKQSLEAGYWEGKQNSPSWHSWAGYAFEAICFKHLSVIRKKLQINPTAIANGWRYVPRAKSKELGAQIDLLFDREDDAITLCEIKYTEEPFAIDKSYAEKLKQKKAVFKEKTRTKKQIFFVMISANDLKKTIYSEDMISGVVTLEDFFNA